CVLLGRMAAGKMGKHVRRHVLDDDIDVGRKVARITQGEIPNEPAENRYGAERAGEGQQVIERREHEKLGTQKALHALPQRAHARDDRLSAHGGGTPSTSRARTCPSFRRPCRSAAGIPCNASASDSRGSRTPYDSFLKCDYRRTRGRALFAPNQERPAPASLL